MCMSLTWYRDRDCAVAIARETTYTNTGYAATTIL